MRRAVPRNRSPFVVTFQSEDIVHQREQCCSIVDDSAQRGNRSILPASLLAEAVLLLHLLWCGWVLLGWTVTRCRPLLRTLHIASLVYAIIIELVPWPPCPLTVAETWLEARAGVEPAHGSFLLRLLDAIVYPNLPVWVVVGGAVLVCLGVLVVYVQRYLRHGPSGEW